MKVVLLFILLFTLGCDSPQRTRFQTSPGADLLTDGTPPDGIDADGITDDNDNGNITDDTSSSTPGFESCNLGLQHYGGTSIGHFGICQSQSNESTFKIKMGSTDSSLGTCFIPLHILGSGNSFKIGIAECVHNQANKTYDVILTKDRAEAINGVMVIKAGSALNSYMSCMSAKNNFILSRPGCQNSPYCLADADAYANLICNRFKGTYSPFYKQLTL